MSLKEVKKDTDLNTAFPPYLQGIHSKTPQWTPETTNTADPYLYYVSPIHTYL